MSRRLVVLVLLGACWSSSPPAPMTANEPGREMMVQMHDPPPCAQFDAGNPACANACPREAPEGWGGCVKWVTDMIAQGYTCPTQNPRQCVAPPPRPVGGCPVGGCVTVKGRIIGLAIRGNVVEVTFTGGRNQGITAAWRAAVVDTADVPVPDGEVTLVRVDNDKTVGTVKLTPDQLKRTPFVRLEP